MDRAVHETPAREVRNHQGQPLAVLEGVHFDFQYSQYTPFASASHVKLPGFLSKKAALVNVQNRDDRCMEYALICGLHYHELENTKNAERVRQTQAYPPWMQPLRRRARF